MNAEALETPDTFRAAVEAHDLEAALGCFASDAVLHSPITFQPFEGVAAIGQLLGIIMEVLEDFTYTDELHNADGTTALIFRARVGERSVQGLDLLRRNAGGQIYDFTVMIRPRSAIEALLPQVAKRLADAASAP